MCLLVCVDAHVLMSLYMFACVFLKLIVCSYIGVGGGAAAFFSLCAHACVSGSSAAHHTLQPTADYTALVLSSLCSAAIVSLGALSNTLIPKRSSSALLSLAQCCRGDTSVHVSILMALISPSLGPKSVYSVR